MLAQTGFHGDPVGGLALALLGYVMLLVYAAAFATTVVLAIAAMVLSLTRSARRARHALLVSGCAVGLTAVLAGIVLGLTWLWPVMAWRSFAGVVQPWFVVVGLSFLVSVAARIFHGPEPEIPFARRADGGRVERGSTTADG